MRVVKDNIKLTEKKELIPQVDTSFLLNILNRPLFSIKYKTETLKFVTCPLLNSEKWVLVKWTQSNDRKTFTIENTWEYITIYESYITPYHYWKECILDIIKKMEGIYV